jgi:hypothetical protein
MDQITLTWLGMAPAPPHSFIIGWEPPGPALHVSVLIVKAPEKEKHNFSARELHLPPPYSLLLLPFPHMTEQVTPLFSIKQSYFTLFCWDFSFWSTKIRIF